MVAMMLPGMASTVSVVREKAPKKKVTQASLLEKFLPGSPVGVAAGPASIGAKRDAWANALENMSGVYTGSPLTAAAKVAGMGFAGYQQGKASKDIEQGQQAFREKLANALAGGTPDNAAIAGLMTDPYAGDNGDMIMKLWERANPEPTEAKPRMATLKYSNGAEFPVDLNDPQGQKLYNDYITKMQAGGPGAPGAAGGVKDPFKITDNLQQSKVQQGAATVAGTLNSMFQSLSDRSAISDLDFVNGVAKILDPNSVVRTEEGRQVIESQSLSSQTLGMLNKLANGETALDPQTRAAMYELAARRGGEMLQQAQKENDFYRRMAEQNGYDPDLYVPQVPQGPRSDFTLDPANPANMPQTPDGWQPPAPGATAPPPNAPVPQPGSPPAASVPAPATTPPPMPQPGPAPAESVQPVTPSAPPIPPALQRVPMLPQLWPNVVQMATNPDGSIDQEALDAFAQRVQQDPRILQQFFPAAFPPGVQQ